MCTLSIVPLSKDKLILTNNRDEVPTRIALAPKLITNSLKTFIAPIDVQSNGTWLGVGEDGLSACLLNGAFRKQSSRPHYHYNSSRGQIIRLLFNAETIDDFIRSFVFKNYAHFTLIIIDVKNMLLHQIRWDEKVNKHKTISIDQPIIWSSPTLYTSDQQKEKERIFQHLLDKSENIKHDLLKLYQTPMNKGFSLESSNVVPKTTATSQVIYEKNNADFTYHDSILKKTTSYEL